LVEIVVAHTANRVIGRDGALPWRLPADMRHFRELTVGHTVLMGRRTFQSLPNRFRPLPDRRNLVLSHDPSFAPAGAEAFHSLQDALEACAGGCMVIGGEVTYRETLPLCGRVHATEIDVEMEGDAWFPELPASEWQRVERSEVLQENGLSFTFDTYERATPSL
jgi:dihydrofolate reductase